MAADDESPFHAGEVAVQTRAGVRERIAQVGAVMIRDFMPDQHRAFFAELPFVVVGSLDAAGRPWASMLTGEPGFITTPDARHARVEALPDAADPLAANLRVGAPLGLLGIQPETRRRNRVNGRVVARDARSFTVQVRQCFGNCPQYIQARTPTGADRGPERAEARREAGLLSSAAAALVAGADTFFIASASADVDVEARASGVDVSHRGGKPGFVRAIRGGDHTLLTWPDFRGNFLFNTLGNLVANPRAGLLFVDFEHGDLLSLTGAAEIVWDGAEVERFAGAERLVRVHVSDGVHMPGALRLRWSAPEFARQLRATGSWDGD